MGVVAKFIRKGARFRGAEAGVAAVEFALILPIMLMVYVGMVEASALISMDRKIQSVSGAVGDLVARSDGIITEATLNDYVRVAGGIMTPYPIEPLVQVVSMVYVAPNNDTSVIWSRRYENQVLKPAGAHETGSSYELPAAIIAIAKEQYVVVAESGYDYKPLYGIIIDQPIRLYRENFYLPRFGAMISLLP